MIKKIKSFFLGANQLKYKKKILITAGGTGGHIFPALSIANELLVQHHIVWVGGIHGIEEDIVKKKGIRFFPIKIIGLRKKGIVRMITYPFIILRALFQALKIILKEKPNVIIGFGGYATFPVCFVGAILGIPTIIHEQNSVAGLTNKVLFYFVSKVLVAYKNVLPSKKTIYVGNPVRKEIIKISDIEERYPKLVQKLNLLIIGGSLGAKALNKIVPLACSKLNNINKITHQIGAFDNLEEIISIYRSNNMYNINVVKFIDNISYEYEQSHLVICRAGASTVSELTSFGIAAIFIPFPSAVDDHQTLNVQELVKSNASILLPQDKLNVENLSSIINSLTMEKCKKMALLTKTFGVIDTTQQIVNIIQKISS